MKPIELIKPPQTGIAPSPLLGNANVVNLDIQSYPGIARLNYKYTASASTISDLVVWFARDFVFGQSYFYAVDQSNKVYKSTDGGATWTVVGDGSNGAGQNGIGNGKGLAIWKNYLFCYSGGSAVDVYGPLDSSASWTKSFLSGYPLYPNRDFNPIFVSIDGNLYIGSYNKVHKLVENAGKTFAPDDNTTYTYTDSAITIGSQYIINGLADLGSNLMIGTLIAADSPGTYHTGADIFPYDRSNLTLGIPVTVAEEGIQQMISTKGALYFFAGRTGNLYMTNGVGYELIGRIPQYLKTNDYATTNVYPGGIQCLNGKIYFACSFGGSGYSGLYSFDLVTREFCVENIASTANEGTTNSIYIGAIMPSSAKYFVMGRRDVYASPAYAIEYIDTSYRYGSYSGYIEGPLINIGQALEFRQIGYLLLLLARPLSSGQGIRIKYRKDLTSAWSTLATIDYATKGAISNYKIPAIAIKNIVFLQARVELTSTDSYTPDFVSLLAVPDEYNV